MLALKSGLSQEDYLDFLARHPESYEDSLEAESRLKHVEEEWEEISFNESLQRLMEEKSETYYAVIFQLLKQAKDDYAKMVSKR